MNALSGVEDMMDVDNDGSDDSEDDGKTATFPSSTACSAAPDSACAGRRRAE